MQDNTAPRPFPRVLPVTGTGRIDALDALSDLIACDASAQLTRMLEAGWPLDVAAAALSDWYAGVARTACDRGISGAVRAAAEAIWKAA